MTSIRLLLLLLLSASCGKIDRVQEAWIGMSSSNDMRVQDVLIGFMFRHNPTTQPTSHDYLEYNGHQYRLGTLQTGAAQGLSALPQGQRTEVYFRGTFARRSGVSSSNPTTTYDVVDLEAMTAK